MIFSSPPQFGQCSIGRTFTDSPLAPSSQTTPKRPLLSTRYWPTADAYQGLLSAFTQIPSEQRKAPPPAQPGLAPSTYLRIKVLLPNRLSIKSTASSAVWLRTSSAGLSSITSRLARRPVSAIISMHSCASR